jgi:hypothetical protein
VLLTVAHARSPPSPFLDNFRLADNPGVIVWWLKTKFSNGHPVVTASTATPGVPFQVKKRKCGRSRGGSDATRVVQAFKHDPEVQVSYCNRAGSAETSASAAASSLASISFAGA